MPAFCAQRVVSFLCPSADDLVLNRLLDSRKVHTNMKIISRGESKQILRNLYKKAAMEKYAEELRRATAEERIRLLAQIDREVEQRVRQQIMTGH